MAVARIFGNLATNLLIFGNYKNMDYKGKILCCSLAVSGAFVFGGQFGFVAGMAPNMIGAFIISKFVPAVLSFIIVNYAYIGKGQTHEVIGMED